MSNDQGWGGGQRDVFEQLNKNSQHHHGERVVTDRSIGTLRFLTLNRT